MPLRCGATTRACWFGGTWVLGLGAEFGSSFLAESFDLNCNLTGFLTIVIVAGIPDEKPINNPENDSRNEKSDHQHDVQNAEAGLAEIKAADS